MKYEFNHGNGGWCRLVMPITISIRVIDVDIVIAVDGSVI